MRRLTSSRGAERATRSVSLYSTVRSFQASAHLVSERDGEPVLIPGTVPLDPETRACSWQLRRLLPAASALTPGANHQASHEGYQTGGAHGEPEGTAVRRLKNKLSKVYQK